MNNFKWIIDNPNDCIQRCLANNQFFEIDDLKFISQFIKPGDIVLDLGANVGNHTVYFSKFTEAKTIYVVEPIPRTYRLLLANLALNYCHNVNVDYVGVAFGDHECIGYPFMAYGKDNLGATYLNPVPLSKKLNQSLVLDPVNIIAGDSVFGDKHLDFIKIDVEGMEMVVLGGLKNTIDRCRPKMFVEILKEHYAEFEEWVKDNNYYVHSTHDKLSQGIWANYMVIPNE